MPPGALLRYHGPMAKPAKEPRRIALRLLTEFRCLADACEDPCCSNWTVLVDEGHYDRIRLALQRDHEADPSRPPPSVVQELPPPRRTRATFGHLQLAPNGDCSLLGPDRLCTLQARHGEDHLPNVCAMYPRTLRRAPQALELSAEPSCPEVSRLLLLRPGAADLIEVDAALLHRGSQVADCRNLGPQAEYLDPLRETLQALLDATDYPLQSRLFFATFFAGNVSNPMLALHDPRSAPAIAEARRHAVDPAMQAALHERLQVGLRTVAPALTLVLSAIGTRVHHESGAFHRFVGQVWRSYVDEPGSGVRVVEEDATHLTIATSAPPLWDAYAARRARVEAVFGDFLSAAFHRFARHYVFREWLFQSPTALVHLQALLLRIAVLRFLLLSHPGAAAAAATGDEAALGRLLVEVSYSFARVVDHNTLFADLQGQALGKMKGAGDVVGLLRI